MSDFAATLERSVLGRRFRFHEQGTNLARDTVAGMTTFIVMSYIIFVNPAILGFAGVEGLQDQGLPFDAVLTSTCLVAGVMTIIMGLYTNMAYAIAPGLGLNAVVAFTLVAQAGLSFPEAMGLVVVEGLAVLILVLVGLREAIMNAIPIELKKAIAIGIGLFIAFIGLTNSGLVVPGTGTPVDLAPFTTWPTRSSRSLVTRLLLVAIMLSAPHHDRETFMRLWDVLLQHKGDRRVAIELQEPERHLRVKIDLNAQIRVRPSEQLVAEVERICGSGSVTLR